jgi:hypothetical protein
MPEATRLLICLATLSCGAPTSQPAYPATRCDLIHRSSSSRVEHVGMHQQEVIVHDCEPAEPRARSPGEAQFLALDVTDRLVWLDCRHEILSARCRADPACEDRERDHYVPALDHTGYLVARGCSRATIDKRRGELAAHGPAAGG